MDTEEICRLHQGEDISLNGNISSTVDPAIHKTMQGNKCGDTKPELVVRKMLRDAGFPGYRIHWKKVQGKPDIAYPGRKIALFVNGCFWHHHEDCKYAYTPKKSQTFWLNKFAENKARDDRVILELRERGWKVFIIWECELKEPDSCAGLNKLLECLSNCQSGVDRGRFCCQLLPKGKS
jgi:DNA mismatch endonuclease (patch repair protein)